MRDSGKRIAELLDEDRVVKRSQLEAMVLKGKARKLSALAEAERSDSSLKNQSTSQNLSRIHLQNATKLSDMAEKDLYSAKLREMGILRKLKNLGHKIVEEDINDDTVSI